jgi:two-component system cell cycle sensor histidine kinase/response regulator CckA
MDKLDITILIAEDEPIVRNLLRAIVQQQGYSFLIAANGQEAMTLSQAYPDEIHMLLTDIQMPIMNGLDLAKEIVKERPSIRILVISGETSDEIRQGNITLPFLKKPFAPDRLLKELRQVLAGPPAKLLQQS